MKVNKLYATYDDVAQEMSPIWQAVNNQVAIRQFARMIFETPQALRIDLSLHCLGYVGTERSCFEIVSAHVEICKADDMLVQDICAMYSRQLGSQMRISDLEREQIRALESDQEVK